MKKSFGDYQRVGKSGRGSLWVGPDHLLVIESSGFILHFHEKYRRIDYTNIHDISWTTTRRRARFTVLFSILLALCLWGLVANIESVPAIVVWGTLCLATGTLFVSNWVRGPTVDLRIRTAVQLLRLRMVTRMSKAESLIRAIAPVCLAHQGGVDATSAARAPGSSSGNSPLTPPPNIAGIKPAWPGSMLVRWALIVQLAASLIGAADPFVPSFAFSLGSYGVGLAAMVLVVAALTRSLSFHLPGGVKFALVGSTILYGVGFVLGIALFAGATFVGLQSGIMDLDDLQEDPNTAILRFLGETHFNDLGWMGWSILIYATVCAAVAAIGIPQAMAKAIDEPQGPPPIPTPASPSAPALPPTPPPVSDPGEPPVTP